MASSSLRRPSRTAPSRPIGPRCAPGQATGEHRLVQTAAGHRLRTEASRGAGSPRPAAHAGRRRRPATAMRAGPATRPRRPVRPCSPGSRRGRRRDGIGVAQLEEAGRLVRRPRGDRTGHHHRVVGDHADRAPVDTGQRGDHLRGESAPAGRSPIPRRPVSGSAAPPDSARAPAPESLCQAVWSAAGPGAVEPWKYPISCLVTATAAASSGTTTSTTPLGACTEIGPTASGSTSPSPPPAIMAVHPSRSRCPPWRR